MNTTSDDIQKPIAYVKLGRGDNHAQTICLIAPDHKDATRVTCTLYTQGYEVESKTVTFQDPIVRLFKFSFEKLKPGVRYNYIFSVDGKELDLGGELTTEDLYFTYWKELEQDSSVILMSCNGVNDFKDKKNKWGMWKRMEEEIKNSPNPPQLLICGGDQYYQDEVEKKWINKLNAKTFKEKYTEFKTDSLKNALSHMSDISYRRLMAQIPSVAMLDDHDITDGAGARLKFFNGEEFTENWQNFASVQRELFTLLQASTNPTPIITKENSAFSFVLDLGHCALVAADLRTEKNLKKSQLQEKDSQEAFFEAIRSLSHKNVMILLPVVPLKNSLNREGLLAAFSRGALDLSRKEKYPVWLRKVLAYIGELNDDITDPLSSDYNKGFLAKLFAVMGEGSKRGTQYTLLSGDIHTGGSVELHATAANTKFKVGLLVSSPIGYQPMDSALEAKLRERQTIEFEHEGVKISGIVNFFTQNRNFMEFTPSLLATKPNDAAYMYEEGIPGARKVLLDSWRTERVPVVFDFTNSEVLAKEVAPKKEPSIDA